MGWSISDQFAYCDGWLPPTQALVNLIWAFGTLGISPGREALDVLLPQAVARASDFDGQHIANLLWALAQLGFDPGREVQAALTRQSLARMGEFQAREREREREREERVSDRQRQTETAGGDERRAGRGVKCQVWVVIAAAIPFAPFGVYSIHQNIFANQDHQFTPSLSNHSDT
jgi:hypothetical protein